MDTAPLAVQPVADRAKPSVSVIICAYADRRWALLEEAITSLQRQSSPPDEVVLVIDHNPQLQARAHEAFPGVRVMPNEDIQGLSGARNTGVRHATSDVLAFLDDDAAGHGDWLDTLVQPFDDPIVMGTGGSALPAWDGEAPAWLPPEFFWVVGASYVGLPVEPGPVRNPIGANMAFRREAFERAGSFTEGIGRVGRTPLGCEETEFSIRVRQAIPGAVILYLPAARVDHYVSPDRTTWRYFASRCWAEGISKALVTALVGDRDGLSSERSYVSRTLVRGFVTGLRDVGRGDRAGVARSGAIVAGLGITSAGFVRGRIAAWSRRRSDALTPARPPAA